MKVLDMRPVIVSRRWSELYNQWGYITHVSKGMVLVKIGEKCHWLRNDDVRFATSEEKALKNLDEFLK